jgi:hypothetical protein
VITTVLLAVLGLALVIVIVLMLRSPSGPRNKASPVAAPASLSTGGNAELFNVRPGDVISIHGAAEDFSDLDFTVDRRSAYQTGARQWIDLSGEFRGHRVYLEVQPGAEPDIMGLLDGRRLTLADIGVSEDDLGDMDAQQNPARYLQFEGKRWQYESSRELSYVEGEQGPGEGVYRWLFREANGPHLLCIEKWEGEPFDVRVAQRVNIQDVNVYRVASRSGRP